IAGGASASVGASYTQTSGGALNIQIGGATASAELVVGNSASLAGTLNVDFIDGFVPSVGQMLPIVSYTSESGTLETRLRGGVSATLDYQPAAAILPITNIGEVSPTSTPTATLTFTETATPSPSTTPTDTATATPTSATETLTPTATCTFSAS